ncbi:MAG TPA: hypothetical protein PKC43_06355 [Phycisphaerales bacterium]|nr:hypothetical protein [Phycisphaerales bacterium]HMP37054.1 hypothetical protein [Phycisphaerales bacterium]
MQILTETQTWHVAYAKRSFSLTAAEYRQRIESTIDEARRRLDEAERRLAAGEAPNPCGVLQATAYELEMAIAKYHAIIELTRPFNMLATTLAEVTSDAMPA